MAPRDNRRDFGRDGDEDAPWLAEADPRARTEVSRRSVFWTFVIIATLLAVAAIGGVLLFSKKAGGSTEGYMNAEQAPLIEADRSPYKVKPSDPRGLAVEGQDQLIYDAGSDVPSTIDPDSLPEQPLPRPGSMAAGPPRDLLSETQKPVPAIAAPVAPAAPVIAAPATAAPVPKPPLVVLPPAPPAPAPVKLPAKTGGVQLGAFSSPELADAAWAGLSGKYGLSGKRVIAVESGGKTLYRLRAGSSDAVATCATIKAGGDACAVTE